MIRSKNTGAIRMNDDSKATTSMGTRGSRGSNRLTIGFFLETSTGFGGFQDVVWKGMIDSAKARDMNVLVLAGGTIDHSPFYPYEKSRNNVYRLNIRDLIDGLVINATVGNYITPAELAAFCSRISPVPIVGIIGSIPGWPCVRVDNRKSFRELILHLVNVHKYRRIAFIKGSKGNPDAEERFEIYKSTLDECGIRYDPEMVCDGVFDDISGKAAVITLFTERNKRPEAIVASNDAMAFGAVQQLRALGKRVPEDVAVTGFDDTEEAGAFFPPLTTIRQPFDEISRTAIGILLEMIGGRKRTDLVSVPAEIVIRQSCGCSSEYLDQAKTFDGPSSAGPGETTQGRNRKEILDRMVRDALATSVTTNKEVLARLVTAFLDDVESSRSEALVREINEVIKLVVETGEDLFPWVQIIFEMKKQIPALWQDRQSIFKAESKANQACVLIGEAAQRVEEYRKIEVGKSAKLLRDVGQELITTFDFEELKTVIKTQLGRIGIPSCFISLYNEVNEDDSGSSVFLSYDQTGFTTKDLSKDHSSHAFPPSRFFPQDRRYAFAVHPLFFKNDRFGYMMFELGPEDGVVYDALQVQIGSSLMGSELLRKREKTEAVLKQRSDRIQGLVRPMIDSIHSLTEIIGEKIGLVAGLASLTKENSGKLTSTNNSIELMGTKIYRMSDVIAIIDDISMVVNILAINTSIEAAHAGKFGKGFSVIAAEIRKLADSIKKNTAVISELIMDIRPDMATSEKAGKESLDAFTRLEKDVLDVAETLKVIARSMEVLSASSTEILSVMND